MVINSTLLSYLLNVPPWTMQIANYMHKPEYDSTWRSWVMIGITICQ